MYIEILIFITFFISSIFYFTASPQIITASLIGLTLLLRLLRGLIKSRAWFSFLLFLVFLGGLLIMLTYIVSLSGKQDNVLKHSNLKLLLAVFLSRLILIKSNFIDTLRFNTISPSFYINKIIEAKTIYLDEISLFYLFLFIYLLLTLIFVIFILKTFSAPLRALE